MHCQLNPGCPETSHYHLYLIRMDRHHLPRDFVSTLVFTWAISCPLPRMLLRQKKRPTFLHVITDLVTFHYTLPPSFPVLATSFPLFTFTAAVFHSDTSHSSPPFVSSRSFSFSSSFSFLLLAPMDPPPTGLLAASTAPPPRQAVFNPYRLPVSPPPGNVRPQPHRQPELLWLHRMVCLAAWTTEALCAHPMMAQDVPPDEHFETISAQNIYIQTRRAVHEFNVQQRRIARGVSLLQHVVPTPDGTTTYGQYRVNPNGFLLPAVPPSPQLWSAHTNVLSTDEVSYMVIYDGKLHDTGLVHRHRLRLTPLRSHHHFLLRHPREF